MDTPKFKIVHTKEGFEIRSEDGTLYGPVVKTQKQAEELLQEWKNYYQKE